MRCIRAAILVAFLVTPTAWGADGGTELRGLVRDRTGAVIAGAAVELQNNGEHFSTTTQADGTFVFHQVTGQSGTLTIAAPGFESATAEWRPGADSLSITLQPAAIQQNLEVTATRTSILPTDAEVISAQPDAVSVSHTQLQQWGALSTDDKLRNIVGFSLLRRSGSQTANPTSQGVSLRGLGASGASRALVLADGIPLNDPFGGWIYWARVPQESLTEVQIVPGGISALYGNDALGGVVNLETRPAIQTEGFANISYGSENSPFGSGWGAMRFGQWSLAAGGEGFRTDGYIAVPSNVRGTVDAPVTSQYGSGTLRLERDFGRRGRTFLQGSLYGEDRKNGTLLQVNDTTIRQLALGTDWMSTEAGLFTLRLYGGTQNYHQTFSSIAADRNSESLTNIQYVPVQQMGLLAQWSKQITKRFTLLAGLDALDVQGSSLETTYSQGQSTAQLNNGGTQRSLGAFVEGVVQITHRWSLSLSGREDLWSNLDGHSERLPVNGKPSLINYPDRGQNAFNPRVSTAYNINDQITLYAAAYRSFRAPTLNELYRSFRVGNVQTLANAYLQAEYFSGAEGGVRATINPRVSLHGNFFWGYTTDPVANVTISSTPQLITRVRENLGKIRSWGLQAGAEIRFNKQITLDATYQFLDSTVISFPADPTLVGKQIPLVPQNEFTFQATWAAPKNFFVAVQGRTASNEFDDDRNTLPLGSYFVLSATVSHPLPRGLDIYFQGENLTNESYEIGRTPVVTLGQPILVRGGVRWSSRR